MSKRVTEACTANPAVTLPNKKQREGEYLSAASQARERRDSFGTVHTRYLDVTQPVCRIYLKTLSLDPHR